MEESQRTRASKKKTILTIFGIVLLVIVAVVGFLATSDSELTPQAEVWFSEDPAANVSLEDNAFFLAIGFGVPDSMDPVPPAREWVEQENARLQALMDGAEPNPSAVIDLPQTKLLADIKENVYSLSKPHALDSLLANAEAIETLYQHAEFLTERYRRLAEMAQFQTPVTPHASANWPQLLPLLRYQKLRHAWILLGYREGERDETLELLENDFTLARMLKREADYMLLELIATVLYDRNLQVVDQLLDMDSPPDPKLVQFVANLQLLSPEENSLRPALIYEGRIAYNTLKAQNSAKFIARVLQKENLTANLIAESHGAVAELSELNGPEYVQRRDNELASVGLFDQLRNLGGLMQLENARAFVAYADAGYDLNGRMLLLKAKSALLAGEISTENIPEFLAEHGNQYYNPFTEKALEWDSEVQQLFYTGPNQEQHEKHRQVTISSRD